MNDFDGFSAEAKQFLTDLRDNNEREWFNERKAIYERELKKPALQFIEALGERLKLIHPPLRYDLRATGSGSLMRIYRDTRFSKDKTPYKTNLGIVFWAGEGKKLEHPGYYFHVSPDECWIGGGHYMFPKPYMEAYREAVADDEKGASLEAAIASVEAAGYPVWGNKYKKVPRGFDKEHPRAELLKHKGMFANSTEIPLDVFTSPDLVDVCFEHCTAIAPLFLWLATQV